MGSVPYTAWSLHHLFKEDFPGQAVHSVNRNRSWSYLEIQYLAPSDIENQEATCPSSSGTAPRLLGAGPHPSAPESSFRVYEAVGSAQLTKFGCILFLSSHKYRQKTKWFLPFQEPWSQVGFIFSFNSGFRVFSKLNTLLTADSGRLGFRIFA